MTQRNKKILIILVVLFFIISLVFIFLKTGSKNFGTIPTENFTQDLGVTNYFKGQLAVENKILKEDFDFPQHLPYLNQKRIQSLDSLSINKIASNFGFENDPIKVNDVKNGEIWIWNGDIHSLVITPKNSEVQVSSTKPLRTILQNTINKQLSDNEYQLLAREFLENKIGLTSENSVFAGFTYFDSSSSDEHLNKTSKENADIIQLNYYQSSSVYPILTTNPDRSPIYVQLLRDGTTLTSNVIYGVQFDNSLNEYPIKNYEQFSKELGNSVLVSLDGGNINIPDIKSSDISNITADEVSLAYLLDKPTQTILQPIFLIRGQALVFGSSEPVEVVMYLKAFK
jgi:hypothetical protein